MRLSIAEAVGLSTGRSRSLANLVLSLRFGDTWGDHHAYLGDSRRDRHPCGGGVGLDSYACKRSSAEGDISEEGALPTYTRLSPGVPKASVYVLDTVWLLPSMGLPTKATLNLSFHAGSFCFAR
jgi:hypothetical protein